MAYDPLEWTLHDAWCGHGFATEIGREACVAFDELGAGQVVAFTEPDYAGSRAVMKRLRLTYTREMCHEGAAFVLYTITRATHTALTPTPSLTREG